MVKNPVTECQVKRTQLGKGGKVVEFNRYDPKTDRNDRQVYIIGKDEDFGEKIAKISTLEALR